MRVQISRRVLPVLSLLAAALSVGLCANAELRLPAIIGDHMVLQQKANTPIWGWADPGEKIRVRIGKHKVQTEAGDAGEWRVNVPPLPVGTAYEMTVSGKKDRITLHDIAVGEVWVCSGQSNMQWSVNAAANAEEEIANAEYPAIRLFTVALVTAEGPLDDCTGEWVRCSPETAGGFSAVGYFFGRKIHRDLGVPVGLINTSWGGTPAQAWTSGETFRSAPGLQKGLVGYHEAMSHQAEDRKRFDAQLSAVEKSGASDAVSAESLAGVWDLVSGPAETGIQSAFTVRVEDGVLDVAMAWTTVPSWDVGLDAGVFKWSFRIPNYAPVPLHVQVNVRDGAALGTITTEGNPPNPFRAVKRSADLERTPQLTPIAPQHRPSRLYNGMIAPLVPYAIQGAIWYQGEDNANRRQAPLYHELFSEMIGGWRKAWDQGAFPFLYVQLANFLQRHDEPQPYSAWAELREAQRLTLSWPNTGMAVIIDIGEADNIHPTNKQDVGKRLALAALAKAYGKDIAYSGPIYRACTIEGQKVRIEFDHINEGLVARNGGLTGFTIAGEDRNFVWAKAEIDGRAIVVWADGIDKPAAVRYAWADNPACNLYNGAGLPASPFRTDDWPAPPQE